jgi:hypothetical protein
MRNTFLLFTLATMAQAATLMVSIPNNPDYDLSFTSSFVLNETNPIGTYTDQIGADGGPVDYALPFDYDQTWTTILGYYDVSPFATPGSSTSGTIRIQYERRTPVFGDLSGCEECYLDVPFAVTAETQSEVPEPATLSLFLLAQAGFHIRQYIRKHR